MRVRGLKPVSSLVLVATVSSHPVRVRGLKHYSKDFSWDSRRSHPVRVRGLKLRTFTDSASIAVVAPRAGAWVETSLRTISQLRMSSHPVRVRGLKRLTSWSGKECMGSHPVRVRGLKQLIGG